MRPIADFKALPIPARAVILFFALAGMLILAKAILSGAAAQHERLVLLILLAAATAHTKIRLTGTSSLSLLSSVVMLSMMTDGTVAAFAVGITGVTVQAFLPLQRFVLHRFVFNAAMVVMAIQTAAISRQWVLAETVAIPAAANLVAICVSSLAYYLSNSMSVSLIIGLTECKPMFRIWLDHFLAAVPSFMSAGLLSLAVMQILAKTLIGIAVLPALIYVTYRSVKLAGRFASANG